MPIDALIANPGRLRILTALAAANPQEFVGLRGVTRLTDGNLSAHAKRLAVGGLVEIEKSFRAGKPVTTIALTSEGRRRLQDHATSLLAALRGDAPAPAVAADEDWVD
jgi:DNA-binding MarR family transcriptional regulator